MSRNGFLLFRERCNLPQVFLIPLKGFDTSLCTDVFNVAFVSVNSGAAAFS